MAACTGAADASSAAHMRHTTEMMRESEPSASSTMMTRLPLVGACAKLLRAARMVSQSKRI